jgi:hypothetical protein
MGITQCGQQEIDGGTFRIDRPVQVAPAAFYPNVGFVDPPRLVGRLQGAGAVVALTQGRNAAPIARPSYDRLLGRVLPAAPQHPAATENIEDTSEPQRE